MAKNRLNALGRMLNLAVVSGVVSGDPVLIGQMPGVALTDRDASGNASVDFEGVYSLSVKGANDAGNVAVAVGDPIYFVSGDTPKLSKKASGTLYGYALAAVTSGSTTTIAVMLAKTARHRKFKSAEQTGNGSAQNVAHGLGFVPSLVLVIPTDTAPATAGAYTMTEGAHDATNCVVTVTTGKKYVVYAEA